MFSNVFLKSFRILLLPFALLYWIGIAGRNWLYDRKIFRSASFNLPLICVGNLSVGGTGKSPMVEYLIGLLSSKFKVATLSRGYKRRTRGYALANEFTTAIDIGDEPMQFHLKFPDVPVAVGEERLVAIPQLLHDRPDTQVIILDDAFQHRSVRAGLNILLTEHANLFTRDFYLPTGDLRDQKSSARRADIIVVTKCDASMTIEEKEKIMKEIHPRLNQRVFFSTISYGDIYHIYTNQPYNLDDKTQVLLVTGIANPIPLKKLLEEQSREYEMLQYPDHYIFTIDDLKDIRKKFRQMESPQKLLLTTEKDAVRLMKFNKELVDLPFYVIPVRPRILFGEEANFNELVLKFITEFKQAE